MSAHAIHRANPGHVGQEVWGLGERLERVRNGGTSTLANHPILKHEGMAHGQGLGAIKG